MGTCTVSFEYFWKSPSQGGRGEACRLRDDIFLGLSAQRGEGAGFYVNAQTETLALELFLPRAGRDSVQWAEASRGTGFAAESSFGGDGLAPGFVLPVSGHPYAVLSEDEGVAAVSPGSGTMQPGCLLRMLPPGRHRVDAPVAPYMLICITAERMRLILGPDVDSLPAPAKELLNGGSVGAFSLLSSEQLLAVRALWHCPYEGAVRNIIFKSRVLEIMALFFGDLAGRESSPGLEPLNEEENALMQEVRGVLLKNLQNPPGISQLARQTGLSETRLKRLFRNAFGMPPYAYLRKERMVRARELILEHGANVGEAAASVGYANVSHFIEAFERQYGVRPGELRRR